MGINLPKSIYLDRCTGNVATLSVEGDFAVHEALILNYVSVSIEMSPSFVQTAVD